MPSSALGTHRVKWGTRVAGSHRVVESVGGAGIMEWGQSRKGVCAECSEGLVETVGESKWGKRERGGHDMPRACSLEGGG